MLALLGSGLGFVGKCGIALGARIVLPVAWPFLRLCSVAAIPRVSAGIPSPTQGIALFLGQPVAILILVEAILRWQRPLTVRRIVLWRRMLPIYAAYVLKEREIGKKRIKYDLSQETVDGIWDEHHEWGGDRVYEMVLEANGYIVKVAQIIASKPDVVPAQWISRLSKLFDAMPPRPWHEVKTILDREMHYIGLGKAQNGLGRLRSVFDHIDEEPIAAASIAQVHCAKLSDQTAQHIRGEWKLGDKVVIKIQRDVVKGLMDADLNNAEMMGEFLKNVLPFEVRPIVCEMRNAIPREFDFVREARLSQAVRSRLASPEFSNLLIPRAAMELCTEKMMVTEFMEGRPFSKLLYETKKDPELLHSMRDAVTTIVKAYGHMMIYDGLFHGDPHPGNLLLGPEGQLILLDFGQCKALPFQKQMAFARLILAMDDGEALSIISALSELGINFKSLKQTSTVSAQDVVKMAFMMYDVRYMPEAQVNPFGGAEEHLLSAISIIDFPPDLWLISRVMMILRGICHDVDIDLHTTKLWKPYALAVLKDEEGARERSRQNQMLDMGTIDPVEESTAPSNTSVDIGKVLDNLWTTGCTGLE